MKPAPPFYYTAIDLFGPLTIRDTVKRRTHGKAFGVIFNCLVTRAVHLDLAEGYSTDDFLTTFQRFIAIRGAPKIIYSDKGTQLISASKKIENIGEKEGVTWIFNMPSAAPWYNGASEVLIKSVKRCLCISVGDNVLNFGELQTALISIANLMNERPIGTKPGFSLELGGYLCPNDLLLGRSTCFCPSGMYDISGDHKRRLKFIQSIIESFWKKWHRDYFPSLLIRQKWHTTRRNVRVGDVVLVQDSNVVRGAWKLVQVIKADPGQDGVVRDVDLRYKIIKHGKGYDGGVDKIMCRSVHSHVGLDPPTLLVPILNGRGSSHILVKGSTLRGAFGNHILPQIVEPDDENDPRLEILTAECPSSIQPYRFEPERSYPEENEETSDEGSNRDDTEDRILRNKIGH
ncbi:uncharacterized protein [Palaemon carinicauda]|uniref:uncharacterized protein n=1 Tax=Palaemon carinicauda TaxID=392227 RepID=UPI0035B5A147